MEGVEVKPGFWRGKRVFVTGHTGFKGAWTSLWLQELGAEVSGYSLAPTTDPCLWEMLSLDMPSTLADLNDRASLSDSLEVAQPDIILHFAAQSLVRRSYRNPVETFATNVLGTVQLLDAALECQDLRAIVVTTSDKAYDNCEQIWGYRETDRLGGRDPYSASKGACEIATAAMRESFYQPSISSGHQALIATARAGNVIGGGDWSQDRLVPDIVSGCLKSDGEIIIRAPDSLRPWQHVFEPIRGYMMLAERLYNGEYVAADAYNFGPEKKDERTVLDVTKALIGEFGNGNIIIDELNRMTPEAKLLSLDSSKARAELGWVPVMGFENCIRLTAEWYAEWNKGTPVTELCRQQIKCYMGMWEQ